MRHALLLLIVVVVTGCAHKTTEPPTTSAEPGIYRVTDAAPLTPDELYETLLGARIVLVGESHDSADDHAVQLKVLEGLAARRTVGLGMEMFQRPFQPALDMFVSGNIDEADMLTQTEWEDRWGFGAEMYRPLWQLARDRGFPIVALNARRELTKRIARVGVAGLSEAERADLPELDLSNQRYHDYLRDVFRSHGADMDAQKLQQFFEAQVTWDETMADTAAKWVEANGEASLVVAVGRGHVERDWGIPSRLRRRLGTQQGDGTVVTVVPVAHDEVPRMAWMQRNAYADYVWVH